MTGRRQIKLMASAEIRALLGGISRQRVFQITQNRTFPEPVAKLAVGNIWLEEDVLAWIREHRPELMDEEPT